MEEVDSGLGNRTIVIYSITPQSNCLGEVHGDLLDVLVLASQDPACAKQCLHHPETLLVELNTTTIWLELGIILANEHLDITGRSVEGTLGNCGEQTVGIGDVRRFRVGGYMFEA